MITVGLKPWQLRKNENKKKKKTYVWSSCSRLDQMPELVLITEKNTILDEPRRSDFNCKFCDKELTPLCDHIVCCDPIVGPQVNYSFYLHCLTKGYFHPFPLIK